MFENEEVSRKQEASLPVQSRVDIRTLANLAKYWSGSGVVVRSVSQLVSWSLEMVQDVLSRNSKLAEVVETVEEANRYLMSVGLYQPGMRKRGRKKLGHALGFENLRYEGIEPAQYASVQHNMLHNKRSVAVPEVREPIEVLDSSQGTSDEEWERVQKRIAEEKEKEKEEALARDKKRIEEMEKDEDGVIVPPSGQGGQSRQRTPAEQKKKDKEFNEMKREVQMEAARKHGVVFNKDGTVNEKKTAKKQEKMRMEAEGGDEYRPKSKEEVSKLYEERIKKEEQQLRDLKKGSEEGPDPKKIVKIV